MRLKTLGLSAAGALALGTFAVANGVTHVAASNCGSAPAGAAVTVAGAVAANPTGQAVTAPGTGVSVCGDPGVAGFNGGFVEIGAGGGPLGPGSGTTTYLTPGVPVGVYVIVQGDNNTDPVSSATGGADNGYVGLSNYESGSYTPGPNDPPCGSGGSSGGTNSGGSVGVDAFCDGTLPAVQPIASEGLPVPFVVCGHVSGNDWQNTNRDGCWEP